jgi:4-methyl-5(b-hydroxyethyl)-thiazole monophosphate biosynthesis
MQGGNMSKNVLVPIAQGSEELEAVCIVDVLRRAGAFVTVASVDQLQIIASKGVRLIADCLIEECTGNLYDLIVLPGGMPGAEHLRDSQKLLSMLKQQKNAWRPCAAICASPAVALYPHGLLDGHRFTCHPNFKSLLKDMTPLDSPVVVDGNLITSRGAGAAVEFSLKLVEQLFGKTKTQEVAKGMVLKNVRRILSA